MGQGWGPSGASILKTLGPAQETEPQGTEQVPQGGLNTKHLQRPFIFKVVVFSSGALSEAPGRVSPRLTLPLSDLPSGPVAH